MSKLLLLDGNSLIYRAYYATCYSRSGMMQTSKGEYTNAVYSFACMFNSMLNMIKPDYCAVAFDKGKHTFRHEYAPDYKAGRAPKPEELKTQFPLVMKMLDAYNVKYFELTDIEADDIIGTFSKKFNIETYIFSGDRDLLQLIDTQNTVCLMRKGTSDIGFFNEEELLKEYRLKPFQVVEWKALAGDKSDNIKGVDKIGDKTALDLLEKYDSVDGIYAHIDEITGKKKEYLIAGKDSAYLSKFLATIKTDVEIDVNLEDLKLNIDVEKKNAFFNEYEMYSLVEKNSNVKVETNVVNKISSNLLDNPLIIVDYDMLSLKNSKVFGLCFINDNGQEYINIEDLLKDNETLNFLNNDSNKTFYDLKNVKYNLKNNGINININSDDLLIKSFLVNNYNVSIESLILNYKYDYPYNLKDIYGTEKNPVHDRELQINYTYDVTTKLYEISKLVAKKLVDDKLSDLYINIEKPLISILYNMEQEGINVDVNILDDISIKTEEKIKYYQDKIYDIAGHEFNIASNKQLGTVLFDELDLPNISKGSTNAETLEKIAGYNPIIEYILKYRKYTKLLSTYSDGLKKFITADNKIHTYYCQAVTSTGRLSSLEPNLQNISVRDEETKEIRRAFLPSKDHYLLSSDYSQVELRMLASLSNEEKMIEAFNNNIDIHTKTAMDIFGLTIDQVDDATRRKAKAINFGVVYGISDFGLSEQAGITVKEAKNYINQYFETYPSIKKFLDGQIEFCKENGYTVTILNRRRYINEINDNRFMIREFGKRAAMNSTIQGSAADLIKVAMVNISKKMNELNLKSKLILQIHDELIFDVDASELEVMKELVTTQMNNAMKLNCKLNSSCVVGKDWYEAK